MQSLGETERKSDQQRDGPLPPSTAVTRKNADGGGVPTNVEDQQDDTTTGVK